MDPRVVIIAMLITMMKGTTFGWTDEAIYGESCDGLVPGCPICLECVVDCWEPKFLECLCIPDVLKESLNDGSGFDGGAICIWAMAEEVGQPTCCNDYYKRSAIPGSMSLNHNISTDMSQVTKKTRTLNTRLPQGNPGKRTDGDADGNSGKVKSRILHAISGPSKLSSSPKLTKKSSQGCN